MTIPIIILSVLFYGAVLSGFISHYRQERRTLSDADAALDKLSAVDQQPGGMRAVDEDPLPGSYTRVWDAFDGLGKRLTLLAIESDELSRRCRHDALLDSAATKVLAEADYCCNLPAELRAGARRPGPVEHWQALDRALARLSAVHASDDAAIHADAHEQISIAARELGDEISADDADADLEHCMFCRRGLEEVRLLATPLAAICSDCADACHERFTGL
jgi:RNA polymerase-binding transcription factor DksA